MNQKCSVWIEKENLDKIIEKIKTHDTDDPLYEGHDIDELYIGSDGDLEGFIAIGDIGLSVWIPFGDWFSNFVKFKAFDTLMNYMEEHQEHVEDVIDNIHSVVRKINESTEPKEN